MMDGSPALYYAQAAWAFQHGNPEQGKNWMANASNLYSAELNRAYAAPFSDLGWVDNAKAPSGSAMPAPAMVQNAPAKTAGADNAAATLTKPTEKVSLPSAVAKTQAKTLAPSPESETSAIPEKVANTEKEREQSSVASTQAGKKRSTRQKSKDDDGTPVSRSRRAAPGGSATAASRPVAAPTPVEVSQPTHQNLGDKVARALLYPFRHRGEKAPAPASAGVRGRPKRGRQPHSASGAPAEQLELVTAGL